LLVLDSSAGKVQHKKTHYMPVGYRYRRVAVGLMTLAGGILLLLFVIWGAVSTVTEILAPPKEEGVPIHMQVDEEAALYTDKDAVTMLVLKLSDDRSEAEQFMLARFEPSEERVYVHALYPQMEAGGSTLAQLYREKGAAGCADALEALFDCGEIYSIGMTFKQIRLMINELGGVTFYVPQAVNYAAPEADRNVNIAKGKREFTGGETARLLNFPDWEGGEAQHREMYCEVLAALINQKLVEGRTGRLKDMFLELHGGAEVDMSMTTFHDKLTGLTYLAEHNKEDGTMVVIVKKKPVFNGDTCSYTDKDMKSLWAAFGDRGEQ